MSTTTRSEFPRWTVAIRTRTRLVGTLNLAIALRGRSSGWGTKERPRRTFVGFHRGKEPAYHRGIEIVFSNDPTRCGLAREHMLAIPLGKGRSTWRFQRRTKADR